MTWRLEQESGCYDGGDSHVSYTRDEKSSIFGCDIKCGMDFKVPIIKNKIAIFCTTRCRYRNTSPP